MAARSQRLASLEGRMLDARVRVFGDCADALYEYERATFNRAKARLAGRPADERQDLRQEAYRRNAKARSAIGQAAILTGREELLRQLEAARKAVGKLNGTASEDELTAGHREVYKTLTAALALAREELTRHQTKTVRTRRRGS